MTSTATIPTQIHNCPVCSKDATQRCGRCKTVWYCSRECQVANWKQHKPICNDAYQADQHTLHKREFDRIVKHYKLDTEEKSEEIAQFLTTQGDANGGQVSAAGFAEKFGTRQEEAVVFLEWIKVGVKFKEQSIDAAKNAGFSGAKR